MTSASAMSFFPPSLTIWSWAIEESMLFRFVAGLLLLIVVTMLGQGIRNRYFHPLSRYPGPFWGSITSLYLAYMIKSVPTFGYEMHQQYGDYQPSCNLPPSDRSLGPIVRLSPNLLSFSDAELLPRVYHSHADKPSFYGSWLFGTTNAMFLTLDHKEHARKRRVIGPCVSLLTRPRLA